MELEEKKYLYLLIIVPVMLLLFIVIQYWKKRKQKQFAEAHLLASLAPDYSVFKSVVKFTVFSLAVIFIIIALANPRIGTRVETVKREGIDIVFALDVSKSMLAEDVTPSRLEKSKQVVSQIINQLAADRIGIVAYAGRAFPVLPITTDYAAAKMFLQSANTDMVSSQGTAIAEAIDMASNFFDDQSQTNKLLVLITDGEDHEEGVIDALDKVKENGIQVLTIGVGTEKGGPIPIKINGVVQTFLRDRNNDVVVTKLNPDVLQAIADNVNGHFLIGNSTRDVVDQFKKILDKIDKSEFESQKVSEFDSKFQWFIAIAIILLIVDVFLLDRKTYWVKKLNLFNEKTLKS